MWNSENTFNADLTFAARLVMTGNATPEQAAALCGLSLSDLDAMLRSIPRPRLQEVEPNR